MLFVNKKNFALFEDSSKQFLYVSGVPSPLRLGGKIRDEQSGEEWVSGGEGGEDRR